MDSSLLILGVLDLAFGVAGLFGKVKIPVEYAGRSWYRAYSAAILIGSLVPGLAYAFVSSHKYKKMLENNVQ